MLAIASYLIEFDAKTIIFVELGASFSGREIGFPEGLNILLLNYRGVDYRMADYHRMAN